MERNISSIIGEIVQSIENSGEDKAIIRVWDGNEDFSNIRRNTPINR
jgi:hypothetical protein